MASETAACLQGRAHVASLGYTPRDATGTVLHQVVREHLESFFATTTRGDPGGLPTFLEQEFRAFLDCGVWSRGFARFQCNRCQAETLVPFSCKRRGFCPSCCGRRMAAGAAELVDHILPHVPIRQWVLSLPHVLRYRLAWDHVLCRAVLTLFADVPDQIRNDGSDYRVLEETLDARRYPIIVDSDGHRPLGEIVVPPGMVLLFGDMRARSRDSRIFGPVPVEAVAGRAAVIWMSCAAPLFGESWLCDPRTIRWERLLRPIR